MRILVADDNVATRIVLRKLLSSWGHEMVEADDGRPAWEMLSGPNPPRIAILDWNMPEVDGVYVCRRLMERGESPFIYTILFTSQSDQLDLLFALENGAHAFLSKPVQPEVLKSHINVGVRIVESEDNVAMYAKHMERLAEERARQLLHADRLATLGTLSASVAHEINNPLARVLGLADTFQLQWRWVEPALRAMLESESAPPTPEGEVEATEEEDGARRKLASVLETMPKGIADLRDASKRISAIITQMRGFARRDTAAIESLRPRDLLARALELCEAQTRHVVSIEVDAPEDLPPLRVNPQLLQQVLINLITNAVHAMGGAGDGVLNLATDVGSLYLRARAEGATLRLTVEDTGPGIPADQLEAIFDPFFTSKSDDQGTGLGLSISRDIVQNHGGTLTAENREKGGARFVITLPAGSFST